MGFFDCGIISNLRFTFTGILFSFSIYSWGVFEPIIAFRLTEFKLSQTEIGLFFMISPIFYLFTSLNVHLISKKFTKRLVLIFGSFGLVFANLLAGPS